MRKSLIRAQDAESKNLICEACEQNKLRQITIGIEMGKCLFSPIHLCTNCGAIDPDLMQFCREITIGCNDN